MLIEYAAFDAAAEMLCEITVNLRIDVADYTFRVDLDATTQRRLLRVQHPRRCGYRLGKGSPGQSARIRHIRAPLPMPSGDSYTAIRSSQERLEWIRNAVARPR